MAAKQKKERINIRLEPELLIEFQILCKLKSPEKTQQEILHAILTDWLKKNRSVIDRFIIANGGIIERKAQ